MNDRYVAAVQKGSLRGGEARLSRVLAEEEAEETISEEAKEYQRLVEYHSHMRPCIHKSYYAMIGFFNPKLKVGMNDGDDG